jgi:putative peptidoglycan lipid II flippase
MKKILKFLKKWRDSSVNKKIFTSALLIAVMTFAVKLASMVKEMFIASTFGAGDELDAFLIAFLLPQFLINVIAGAFPPSLIPVLSQSIHEHGMSYARKMLQESLLLSSLFLLAATLLIGLLIPLILPWLGSGFSAEKIELTGQLSYWLLPVIIINGLSVLASSILNTRHSYVLPAIAPIMIPLTIGLVLIFFVDGLGIHGLAIGMLIGSLLQFLILVYFLMREGWNILPKWYGDIPQTSHVIQQYVPIAIGSFLMSSIALADQSMAAMLDSGSVASLEYGSKFVALVLGIGATALSTAILPYFSQMVAENNKEGVRDTLLKYVKIIILVSIPLIFVLSYLSEFIISLLFERGSFTREDTQLVAEIQIYYLLQVPFYLIGIIGVRLINAIKGNKVFIIITSVNLLVNVIGNWLFMSWLGVAGIALSTAVVYVISTAQIYYVLRKFEYV